MKEKPFNCFWSHICRKTELCCSFCKTKNCEWRCTDNPKDCIYKDVVEEESSSKTEITETIVEENVENNTIEEEREITKTKPSICKFWS